MNSRLLVVAALAVAFVASGPTSGQGAPAVAAATVAPPFINLDHFQPVEPDCGADGLCEFVPTCDLITTGLSFDFQCHDPGIEEYYPFTVTGRGREAAPLKVTVLPPPDWTLAAPPYGDLDEGWVALPLGRGVEFLRVAPTASADFSFPLRVRTIAEGAHADVAQWEVVILSSGADAGNPLGANLFTDTLRPGTTFDLVPPQVTALAACGDPGTNDWCKAVVGLSVVAVDPLAGLATPPTCTLDGSSVPCETTSGAEGSHAFSGSATDRAGNTASHAAPFQVDRTAPTVSLGEACPLPGLKGWCRAPVPVTASATDTALGSQVATLTCTLRDVPADCDDLLVAEEGASVVDATAVDAAGWTGQGTLALFVDTLPPVLPAPAPQLGVEATGPLGAVVTFPLPVAVEATSPPATEAVCTPASGSRFALGTTTVSCTASDQAGNVATATFPVQVVDTTPPAIAVPPQASAEATGPNGAPVHFGTVATTDIVDGAGVASCAPATGSTFPLGSTAVVCWATDAADNRAERSFGVTVVDTSPPQLHLPDLDPVEATDADGAVVPFVVTATDLVTSGVVPVCSPAESNFPLGTTTVTCSASDQAGNVATGTFDVLVRDTTAPDLVVPEAMLREADGPDGAFVDYVVLASDAVDSEVLLVCTPPGGNFAVGNHTVTCVATDDFGNKATASFGVSVVDSAPPVLFVPDDLFPEATGPLGALVDFAEAVTAVDFVSGPVPVTCTPESGSFFTLDLETEVSCQASDGRNTAGKSFLIKVVDTTPPALTVPGDLTFEATSALGATIAYVASAQDLVDGPLEPTCLPASGATLDLDQPQHLVTCNVRDARHNAAPAKTFLVTITDTQDPVATVLEPAQGALLGTATTTLRFRATDNHRLAAPTLLLDVDNLQPVQTAIEGGFEYTATVGGLVDGLHEATLTVQDQKGNSDAVTVSFTTDTLPPAVVLNTLPGATLTQRSPLLTFTATDVHLAQVRCAFDGAALAPCPGGVATAELQDGAHTFTVQASDLAGHVTTSQVAFSVDATLPVARVLPLSTYQSESAFALSWEQVGDDDAAAFDVQFRVPNNPAFATWAAAFTNTTATAGVFDVVQATAGALDLRMPFLVEFRARATDLAGNVGDFQASPVGTTVDALPPVARLDLPLADSAVAGLVNVTGQVGVPGQALSGWRLEVSNDGGLTFRHLANGTAPPAGVRLAGWSTKSLTVPDGPWLLRLNVTSAAGKSNQTLVPVLVDNTGPVVLALVSDLAHANSAVWSAVAATSFTWTFVEPLENVTGALCEVVRGDTTTPVPCDRTAAAFTASDGVSTFTVRGVDHLGNVGLRATHTFRVDTTAPAVTLLTPAPATDAERVTLRLNATDGHAGVRSVRLLVDSPTVLNRSMILSGGSFAASVGPFASGDLRYRFVVEDGAGNLFTSAPQVLRIRDATPPAVRITQPTASVIGGSAVLVAADLSDLGSGLASARALLRNATGVEVLSSASQALTGTAAGFSAPLDVRGLANGNYQLVVNATDRDGNPGEARLDVLVANAPVLQAVDSVVQDRNLTLRINVQGSPSTQVKLHYALRGALQPVVDMVPQPDGVWIAPLTNLDYGVGVTYLIEARDGAAAARWPASGGAETSLPVPSSAATDLAAWSHSALAQVGAGSGSSDGHPWVEITQSQFTHDGITATLALQVNGTFPTQAQVEALTPPAELPDYRVEFLAGTSTILILQGNYTEPTGTWNVAALDGAGVPVAAPGLTVLPSVAQRSVAFSIPVATLQTLLGTDTATAQVRFRALGSDVVTSVAAFDITEPTTTASAPATVPSTQPLALTTPQVSDNADVTKLKATLTVTTATDLQVLNATITPDQGSLTKGLLAVPGLGLLDPPPGPVNLVLTVVDGAGNSRSTNLSLNVVDAELPQIATATLGAANLLDPGLGETLQVSINEDLLVRATITDNVGLASTTAVVNGVPVPLLPTAAGPLEGLVKFALPGRHTFQLLVVDLAGNERRIPANPLTLSVPVPLDVLEQPVVRAAGTPYVPLPVASLEAGTSAVVSVVVSDTGLGLQVLEAFATGSNGAPLCSVALTEVPSDPGRFEGLLPCDLPVGVATLRAEGRDLAEPPNLAVSLPVTVTVVDTTSPTLTLSDLPDSFVDRTGGLQVLRILASDAGGLRSVTVNLFRDGSVVPEVLHADLLAGVKALDRSLTLDGIGAGRYRLEVTVSDSLACAPGRSPCAVTLGDDIEVLDSLPPVLVASTPGPGVVTALQQVSFTGQVLDFSDVQANTVAFFIDGQRVTNPSLTALAAPDPEGRQGVAYAFDLTLGKGRHEFRAQAADLGGAALDRQWVFFVQELPPSDVQTVTPPPPPPAASGSGASGGAGSGSTGGSGSSAPPCTTCLQQASLPGGSPPVAVAAPALPAVGSTAEVQIVAPGVPLTAVALVAEQPVEGARVVVQALSPSQGAANNFEALYQQIEVRVEDANGEVAPVNLQHLDFRVPRTFVDGAGLEPGAAVLVHLEEDGSWTARDTALVDADGAYYAYRAEHGGRSTFAIVFDRAAPVVELLVPAVANIRGLLHLEAVARDDTAVKELLVTLDGALLGSGAPTLRLVVDASTLAQAAEGSLTFAAEAKDATGKAARAVKVVLLEGPREGTCPDPSVDQAAPSTTLSYEGGDAARFGDILGIKGPVDIRFTALDQGPAECVDTGLVETRYSVDGGPVLAGLRVSIRADQPHTLEYWSVDSKGNEEAHQTLRIVPAEGADTSEPGSSPSPEALAKPKGAPGFEAVLLALAAVAVALAQRRRRA